MWSSVRETKYMGLGEDLVVPTRPSRKVPACVSQSRMSASTLHASDHLFRLTIVSGWFRPVLIIGITLSRTAHGKPELPGRRAVRFVDI